MMNVVGEIVCAVYAAGARLVVLDGGIGVEGEVPGDLKQKIHWREAELLEALDGDPLQGPGWEARTALYRRALLWFDGQIVQMGSEGTLRERAATDALCRHDAADRLNRAWCDGTDLRRVSGGAPQVRESRSQGRQKQSQRWQPRGRSGHLGPGSRAERSRT